MTTEALITIAITWGYILVMVTYFFVKVVRKDLQRKRENPAA